MRIADEDVRIEIGREVGHRRSDERLNQNIVTLNVANILSSVPTAPAGRTALGDDLLLRRLHNYNMCY